MGRLLVVVGIVIAGCGLLLMAGVPLGRLPGDLVIRRGGTTIYLPLVTCLVLSLGLTLALSWRGPEFSRRPRNVLTVCLGKSTYARCGIIVNVTPFEPEWEGTATLEISNTTPLPAKVYANEGLAQVLFFQGDEPPLTSYGDKKGKYQAQREVTLPRMDGGRP